MECGIVRIPERYRYSGDRAYLQGKATEMIDPAPVLSMLGGKQAYRRFVQDGMSEGQHKEESYAVEDQCRANHFIMTVRFLRRNLDLMIA